MDNRRQLRENVRIGFWGVWIVAHGDFDHGQPNRPHVGGDGVRSEVVL